MAERKNIIIGNQSNDGTGDSIRDAFDKVNKNFIDIYDYLGAGNGFSFLKLKEAPVSLRASNSASGEVTLLGINEFGTKIFNKTMVAGTGMQLELYDDKIVINSTASTLRSETRPILGGDLDGQNAFNLVNMNNSAPLADYDAVSRKWVYDNFVNRDGQTVYDDPFSHISTTFSEGSTVRHNVRMVTTATSSTHLVNKGWADSKVSLAGISSYDPEIGAVNPAFGTMTGALLLFRDPIETDHPNTAATKRFVENSAFASSVNFFVSVNGRDNRRDIPGYKKGRAFSYAFKTINRAAEAAEMSLSASQITLGPYQKTITVNNNATDATIASIDVTPLNVLDAASHGVRLAINVPTSSGSDGYIDGSIFPGNYIVGSRTGAVGALEKISHQYAGQDQEVYDIVPVDYGMGFTTDLTVPAGVVSDVVTFKFLQPNLIAVPQFWIGHKFTKTDSSYNVIASGTITAVSYAEDIDGDVYDTITVDFSGGVPLPSALDITYNRWHVYAPDFLLGEELIWGQRQVKDQISIMIESGEHEDQYPIKIPNNVSLRGDEFRRSIIKPAKLYGTQLSSISSSKWANTKFYRDTQIDGIIPVQLDTTHNFTADFGFPVIATPDSLTGGATTGIVVFTITKTSDGAPVDAPASWIGKAFQQTTTSITNRGVITAVIGNTFAVDLAENSVFERALQSTMPIIYSDWQIYSPINYGYHYLRDAARPVNILTTQTNVGRYIGAATLLEENKTFIQDEVVSFIETNYPATLSIPGWDEDLCRRDTGSIVDGVVADLLDGGSWRSINNGDSIVNYVQTVSTACVASIHFINSIAQDIITNNVANSLNQITPIVVTYNNFGGVVDVPHSVATAVQVGWTLVDPYNPHLSNGHATITAVDDIADQITINQTMALGQDTLTINTATITSQFIDTAYVGELGTNLIISDLIQACARIVNSDVDFNPPKYNDQMDVFLMNDSTMIRYISCQGHGGFMKVLDPDGQILAKSPYTQTASSFSKSYNRHVFSGGMFVDGFSGNVSCTPSLSGAHPFATPDIDGNPTLIPVEGLGRPSINGDGTFIRPQVPCFFVNEGISYQVDFISEWNASSNTGVLHLDPAKAGGVSSLTGLNVSGFKHSTTTSVTFTAPTIAGGMSARGTAVTNGSGVITSVTITYPGVGYSTAPTYTIGGAYIGFSYDAVTGGIPSDGYTIVLTGAGYAVNTPINFSTPVGGTAAEGHVATVDALGGILTIAITAPGDGYNVDNPPTISFGTITQAGTVTIQNGFLGELPDSITLVTAGNRSMLANDFTQLNDLGYGIFATNGAFIENVSMFTYYCYSSYYALNGSQVRTITGSSAYGVYGLTSEGSDPNETPIPIINKNAMSVMGTIYNEGSYISGEGDATVYVDVPAGYIPQPLSKIDFNQSGVLYTYNVKSATRVLDDSLSGHENLYALAIDNGSGGGLSAYPPATGVGATLRLYFDLELIGVRSSAISRPSTVLMFNENPNQIYRVLSFTDESNDIVLAESDKGYEFINLNPYVNDGGVYRQGIGNVSINDINYVGATHVGVLNTGTGYSLVGTYNVTFPTPPVRTAQVNGAHGTSIAPVDVITIAAASGIIHPGMVVTASGSPSGFNNTTVLWANSYGSATKIRLSNPIYNLANSAVLTFTGVAASGTAHVGGTGWNGIDYITVTESGIGYETPTVTATVDSPGGGFDTAEAECSVQGILGANIIKIVPLGPLEEARLVTGLTATTPYYYYFGYQGNLYRIYEYHNTSMTDNDFAEVVFVLDSDGTSGLQHELMPGTLYAGIGAGQPGSISVKISTLRATSHDMVDVGTGSYSDSKIPRDLYGPPNIGPYQTQEVLQIGKGRVYYVTTDQDGNFRVGESFSVDQGRGTVSISAPISLTNVDGISFKRGDVLVNRFSTDGTMAANATNKVPVEQAIVTYIDKRLGLIKGSGVQTTGLIGPGYLDSDGTRAMKGDINMATFRIRNLDAPSVANGDTDAANKAYVDLRIHRNGTSAYDQDSAARADWGKMQGPLWAHADPVAGDPALQVATKRYVDKKTQLASLNDVDISSPADKDLLMFTSTVEAINTTTARPIWTATNQTVNVHLLNSSNVAFTRTGNNLNIGITDNTITNVMVKSDADIAQSKLFMNTATVNALMPSGTWQDIQARSGVASFNNADFTATNAWISLKDQGVQYKRLVNIAGPEGGLLGNSTSGNVVELNSSTVQTFLGYVNLNGSVQLTGSLLPAVSDNIDLGGGANYYSNVYGRLFQGTATNATTLLSSAGNQSFLSANAAAYPSTIVERDSGGDVYARQFHGNLYGGIAGKIVYQTSTTTTNFVAVGGFGDVLTSTAGGAPSWVNTGSLIAGQVKSILTRGTYLTGNNFDGSAATTWAVDATSSNTPSKVVVRDASGNFSAGEIAGTTATFSGRISGASVVSAGIITAGGTVTAPTFAGQLSVTNLVGAVSIGHGGTGATSAAQACTNLINGVAGAGTTGQVLTTDGSGSFYWSAGGGGGGGYVGTRIASTRNTTIASAGQTLFTAPTYLIGADQLRVYINGVRQDTSDYTELSTTEFVMGTGLVDGDLVLAEVDGYYVYDYTAAAVTFSPISGVSATDVQTAIAQLNSLKLPRAGGTVTGDLTMSGAELILATGTASKAPLLFGAGTNLTSPITGSVEFDGLNLFVTDNTPTRQTLAYQSWVTGLGYQTSSGSVASATNATNATNAGALMYNSAYRTATDGSTANSIVARNGSGNSSFNALTVDGAVSTPQLLAGIAGDSGAAGTLTGQWTLSAGSAITNLPQAPIIGQTWTNMAGLRGASVNYLNDTGKTIQVLCTYGCNSGGSGSIYIDNVRIGFWAAQFNGCGGYSLSPQALIPPGSYYRVENMGGAFVSWYELR